MNETRHCGGYSRSPGRRSAHPVPVATGMTVESKLAAGAPSDENRRLRRDERLSLRPLWEELSLLSSVGFSWLHRHTLPRRHRICSVCYAWALMWSRLLKVQCLRTRSLRSYKRPLDGGREESKRKVCGDIRTDYAKADETPLWHFTWRTPTSQLYKCCRQLTQAVDKYGAE